MGKTGFYSHTQVVSGYENEVRGMFPTREQLHLFFAVKPVIIEDHQIRTYVLKGDEC